MSDSFYFALHMSAIQNAEYFRQLKENTMNAQTFGQDINAANKVYASVAAGNAPPPPPSEHSDAMSELEGEIKQLGATVKAFIARLEPVSKPPQPSPITDGAKTNGSAIPVVQKVNRLKSFVHGHMVDLEDAMQRLCI